MHYRFLLVQLAAALVSAQTLTVKQTAITGVEISAPASSRFASAVSKLDEELRGHIQLALDLSIAVRNTSDRTIPLFVVRYEFQNSLGQPLSGVLWQDFRGKARAFEPGDVWVVTPSNTLTYLINAHPELGREIKDASALRDTGALRQAKDATVSLDLVVLGDGTTLGPDTSAVAQRLRQERAAFLELREEIESRLEMPDLLRAYLLETIYALPKGDQAQAVLGKRRAAVALLQALEREGVAGMKAMGRSSWLESQFPNVAAAQH